MQGDEVQLNALCALPRSSCAMPRCRANAKPTGKLVRVSDRWFMEHLCPDCDERYDVWFPELEELVVLLDAAPVTEHETIAAIWVAGPQSSRFLRD